MRLFYKKTFVEIERKIGIKAATARGIWQWVENAFYFKVQKRRRMPGKSYKWDCFMMKAPWLRAGTIYLVHSTGAQRLIKPEAKFLFFIFFKIYLYATIKTSGIIFILHICASQITLFFSIFMLFYYWC